MYVPVLEEWEHRNLLVQRGRKSSRVWGIHNYWEGDGRGRASEKGDTEAADPEDRHTDFDLFGIVPGNPPW